MTAEENSRAIAHAQAIVVLLARNPDLPAPFFTVSGGDLPVSAYLLTHKDFSAWAEAYAAEPVINAYTGAHEGHGNISARIDCAGVEFNMWTAITIDAAEAVA